MARITPEAKRRMINFTLEGEKNNAFELEFAINKLKNDSGSYSIGTQNMYGDATKIIIFPREMVGVLEKRLKEHQREIKKLEHQLSNVK